MNIEITKEQAKIMWIQCNQLQHRALTCFKELAEDHASVRYAETEEDLRHVTADWVKETRKEYDELANLKEKLTKVMFSEVINNNERIKQKLHNNGYQLKV